MPASETPTNPPETEQQSVLAAENSSSAESANRNGASPEAPVRLGYSTSRYVDYDTHELLERITQYEDERRWQRIREGIWISILAHILFFSLLTWIPRYVFHQPEVIDPFDAIKQRKDLTYLDEVPDAIKEVQKLKPKVPAIKPQEAQVDKKTMDALKALEKAKPKPPAPAPEVAKVEPPPTPQPEQPPAPASVAPPQPSPQIPLDAPRAAPVPAKPNFSLNPQSPADQLRQAMRDSAHGSSDGAAGRVIPLPQVPEASTGGYQVLSDLQGVDFSSWFPRMLNETRNSWYPLIPEEVRPPIGKRGVVAVRFKVLPNGRVMPGSMALDGRSGDTALDRAAWGAITGANYPPVPRDFHGPFVELRIYFLYNPNE